MAVFKRYKGERITAKHPAYAKARWWVYRRLKAPDIFFPTIETFLKCEFLAEGRTVPCS